MAGKPYQNVFKNIFEYHTQGILNDSEFCELMDLIYYRRWDESKYDPSRVSEKVRIAWQVLEPTIKKSGEYSESDSKKEKKSSSKKKIKPNKDFDKVVVNYVGELDDSGNIVQEQEDEKELSDIYDDTETDKADILSTFLKKNIQYVENNKSFTEALQHNSKLNNFCGENGITAHTGNYVFNQIKSEI